MTYSRRRFLRNTSFTLAALGMGPLAQAAASRKYLVGIQLYSVRADMAKNPLATLKALADQGYRYVEHANYANRKFYGFSPADFKKILNDLGLFMPSGHTVMGPQHWDPVKKELNDLWKHTVEDAAIVGQELVISPWLDDSLRKTADDLKRYMDVFNASGKICQAAGMRFGYHNHNFEFTQKLGDQTVYDIILQHTDPALVVQQLDIGNLYETGADAYAIVKNNPGRFVSLHVKDEVLNAAGKYESTVLGKGVQKVKEITDLALKGGARHLIIEQEAYQGKAPLDCAKENLEQMLRWKYKNEQI